MSIFSNIFFFILAIGVLVTFHEYGHYWVARKSGVKVLKFSVGFGRPLYKWVKTRGADSVEFVIAAIPLGGYVKMLDEREGVVPEEDKPRAFNTQPVATRFAIVIAGPLFNFILAFVFFWLVYVMGITATKPLLGEPEADSIAARANFIDRDEIIMVGKKSIKSWQEFRLALIQQGLDGGVLPITVREENDLEVIRHLDLGDMQLLEDEKDVVRKIGFTRWWPELPPVIGGVLDDGAASKAGLLKGDLIKGINRQPVERWDQVVEIVKSSPGKILNFEVERDSQVMIVDVIPEVRKVAEKKSGFIGAYQDIPDSLKEELTVELEYNAFESIGLAITKTWDTSILTLRVFGKIISGEATLKNISGPVTIAQYAGLTASIGFSTFIGFLAIISVSLGVLNLLPIPMLDGGHLFYYLIEIVKGSPVSEAFEAKGQVIGIVLLGLLMCVALFNDFQRLMQ